MTIQLEMVAVRTPKGNVVHLYTFADVFEGDDEVCPVCQTRRTS